MTVMRRADRRLRCSRYLQGCTARKVEFLSVYLMAAALKVEAQANAFMGATGVKDLCPHWCQLPIGGDLKHQPE